MHKPILFILFCTSALFTACAPPFHSRNFTFSKEESVGILGGEEVQSDEGVALTTVGLYDEKNGSHCTGSLIAEDTVLTAAHCVDPSSHQLQILFAKKLWVDGKLNRAKLIPAISFLRHPKYNPDRSEGVDTADLALVHFSGGLAKPFLITSLSENVQSVSQAGAELWAAGFGVSNGFFNTGGGILREVQLPFRQMHSATEFETVQNSKGVCSGDSGGPLYQKISGQLIQVGVASRVATKFLSCRDYAVYTRVDVYKDWISETASQLRAGAHNTP